MKRLAALILFLASTALPSFAKQSMHSRVSEGDTVYVDAIMPARVVAKGKDWRKNRRLVYNFSKTYVYALEARRMVGVVDSKIDQDNLRRRKKTEYINAVQKDILEKYEPVIRNMTVSQGKLLIKLIGRETGLTPYEIVHNYKNGMAAGFWQGIAKFFGGDLKKRYDPEGEDAMTEELVRKWQKGEFPEFYRSIFGQYPKIPVIPS